MVAASASVEGPLVLCMDTEQVSGPLVSAGRHNQRKDIRRWMGERASAASRSTWVSVSGLHNCTASAALGQACCAVDG